MSDEKFKPYEEKPLSPKDFEDTPKRIKDRNLLVRTHIRLVETVIGNRDLAAELAKLVRKEHRIQDRLKFVSDESEKMKIQDQLKIVRARINQIQDGVYSELERQDQDKQKDV